jgi:hypothetical protein
MSVWRREPPGDPPFEVAALARAAAERLEAHAAERQDPVHKEQ